MGINEQSAYTMDPIKAQDLSAIDLQEAAEALPDGVEAYSITIWEDAADSPCVEGAEALWLPAEGRIGIAWGADAEWGDASSPEQGIEMWLHDPEAWEAAN
jgi:hypothetical protein